MKLKFGVLKMKNMLRTVGMTCPYQPPLFDSTGEQDRGEFFADPKQAIQKLTEIYNTNISYISHYYKVFCHGAVIPEKIEACYPEIRFTVSKHSKINPVLSHGFFDALGVYSTTITQPQLFAGYLEDQISRIMNNHKIPVEVRVGTTPIPVKFLSDYDDLSIVDFTEDKLHDLHQHFTNIDNTAIDDAIADGEYDYFKKSIKPLSLFDATRIDLSLQRLQHYTGTSPAFFQPFIIFTNYQLHTECFFEFARDMASGTQHNHEAGTGKRYLNLVLPGDQILPLDKGEEPFTVHQSSQRASTFQMPAHHLLREDGLGITVINIGVGPSNAKTITDCLAVLRPHCWLMIGHCAGLDARMRIGDMVLANAYERKDGVLDRYVPLHKPIASIAEVQTALAEAVQGVTGLTGSELNHKLRTGTVMTVADRNWEWIPQDEIHRDLQKSTAITVDMESATIAANGYRFRVPYGVLLSVSDKPLHNQPKLPRSAKQFYQHSRTDHIMAAIRACEFMADDYEQLHSRKLRRPIGETAFR